MDDSTRHPASFRDPSGFVFRRGGRLFRQVNRIYRPHYERLVTSGLYDGLAADGLIAAHDEVDVPAHAPESSYKIIEPVPVPFLSYPYEWCFGQLKAAAMLTLDVQRRALDRGMTLKDASAFNVQFLGGRPVFIDTLSFETLRDGEPWVAYRQFCEHFLAPLALMAGVDVRLGRLWRANLDGVPLGLASKALPPRSWLRPSLLIHVHLHALAKRSHDHKAARPASPRRFSKTAFLGLIDSLTSAVNGLTWAQGTEWSDYYGDTNYSPEALAHKERLVSEFLDAVAPAVVWDLGANTGRFSRIASARGSHTVAFDVDFGAVERNYRDASARSDAKLLPLLADLTDPTPGLGWDNRERTSLIDRGPADAALALALIHHLAISGNVPLGKIAEFLAKLARTLIIEFVPKTDSQVGRLLVVREDLFPDYTRDAFEAAFARHFRIERVEPIDGTDRVLYLMRANGGRDRIPEA